MKEYLQHWDGKHIEYLIQWYADHVNDSSFVDSLIQLYVEDRATRKATSWLLKHHSDNQQVFNNSQKELILSIVEELEDWEIQLHILQLIPKFSINEKVAEQIEPFVRVKMNSDKKFVKATAYEAYFEIVKIYPELKNEFQLLCEEALRVESASIKAKVRKIFKEIEKGI